MEKNEEGWAEEIRKQEAAEEEATTAQQMIFRNALISSQPKFVAGLQCLNALISNSSPHIIKMSDAQRITIALKYAEDFVTALEEDNE